MTKTTTGERMARIEQKQDDMSHDLTEVKQEQKEGFIALAKRIDDLSEKIDAQQEKLNKKFITRAEAYVVGLVITFAAIVINLWLNINDHLK